MTNEMKQNYLKCCDTGVSINCRINKTRFNRIL